MARAHWRRARRIDAWVVIASVASLATGCATYENSTTALDPIGDATAGGGSANTAGAAGLPAQGQAGSAGTSGSGGSGGMTAGASGSMNDAVAGGAGMTNVAGSSGAGAGGTAGSGGGSGGSGGSAGSGGAMPPTEALLSQGKAASADSEQPGNLAALGNDGSATTRWCAADSALNHHWQVDLGATKTLTRLQISWEKASNYQFKVEGSADGNAYFMLSDQTGTSNADASQTYPLNGAPEARFVRVTVTGLPNTNVWASFFEFAAYGY